MYKNNCPYCGRQLPYIDVLLNKTEGEYVCRRCKKESKVVIKKAAFVMFGFFLAFALLLFIIMAATGFLNFFSFFLVALPFLVYYAMGPMFLAFMPLKKYREDGQVLPAKANATHGFAADDYEGFNSEQNLKPVDFSNTTIDSNVFKKVRQIREKKFGTEGFSPDNGSFYDEQGGEEEQQSLPGDKTFEFGGFKKSSEDPLQKKRRRWRDE